MSLRESGGQLGDCSILTAEQVFQGRGSDQFFCMLLIGVTRQELKVVSQCRGRHSDGKVMGTLRGAVSVGKSD